MLVICLFEEGTKVDWLEATLMGLDEFPRLIKRVETLTKFTGFLSYFFLISFNLVLDLVSSTRSHHNEGNSSMQSTRSLDMALVHANDSSRRAIPRSKQSQSYMFTRYI